MTKQIFDRFARLPASLITTSVLLSQLNILPVHAGSNDRVLARIKSSHCGKNVRFTNSTSKYFVVLGVDCSGGKIKTVRLIKSKSALTSSRLKGRGGTGRYKNSYHFNGENSVSIHFGSTPLVKQGQKRNYWLPF